MSLLLCYRQTCPFRVIHLSKKPKIALFENQSHPNLKYHLSSNVANQVKLPHDCNGIPKTKFLFSIRTIYFIFLFGVVYLIAWYGERERNSVASYSL